MKPKEFVAAVTFAMAALPAVAGPDLVAKIPLSGGSAVYELYMDRAVLPECQNVGSHPGGLLAKLETPKGIVPYGTGCWIARVDGYIWMAVKSFDDGVIRETVLHNSKFQDPKKISQPSDKSHSPLKFPEQAPNKVKELIHRVDTLAYACRDSSGQSQRQACQQIEPAIKAVMKEGWCWGPDDLPNDQKNWIPCK